MHLNLEACRTRARELKEKRMGVKDLQELLGMYWPYHAAMQVIITDEKQDESDRLTEFLAELKNVEY